MDMKHKPLKVQLLMQRWESSVFGSYGGEKVEANNAPRVPAAIEESVCSFDNFILFSRPSHA